LVICAVDGRCVDARWTDEKGYKKSIESGILWEIHTETGRLLPYEERTSFQSLRDNGTWYSAILPLEPESSESSAGNLSPAAAGDLAESRNTEDVLDGLYTLITDRKKNLPEGSYTTYLFTQGIEKIRKKTGEEAVELILARKKEDIVSETADLFYHILVLLAGEAISLDEILSELKNRG
jgi:phosphoribosyl-ATP pyrophosphohydrolase